jgi:hypothetical protein
MTTSLSSDAGRGRGFQSTVIDFETFFGTSGCTP